MSDTTIKPSLLYGLLVLVMCLGSLDAYLLVRLKHQDGLLVALQYENETLSQAPTQGQLVPLVQGLSMSSKEPTAVKLGGAHQLVLLVFSQSCKFCEENWKHWDALFDHSKSQLPIYLLSADKSLPPSYIQHHPLLTKGTALVGVDPEVLHAFNVASTPQTIYVVDGKVQRDWVGLLSTQDLNEIKGLVLDATAN